MAKHQEGQDAHSSKPIRHDPNLEAVFAGESTAHINYHYFAKLTRAAGAPFCPKEEHI